MNRPEISIRDLRNHGGDVVDRAAAGEHLTITRSGRPVAELGPLRRRPLKASVLLERWRQLPHADPARWRENLDQVVDPSL
jgi:prevent-host-death family protein